MRNLIITILLAAFFSSCSGQVSNDSIKFRKEIPTWNDGEPDLFYKLAQQKAKQLKIDTLQSGYDSLQIRIWYDYSLFTLRKLVIIKRSNAVWSAMAYTMEVDWNYLDLTETVGKKEVKALTPKNGWGSFLERLFALQIMTLPNMRDIPGLQDGWTDGINYNVEVATKKQYRFYGYHLPDEFQDRYWQAKNMVDILNLVETEFGITSGIR